MRSSLHPQTHTIGLSARFFHFFTESEVFDIEKFKENKKVADEVNNYVLSKITKVATWGIDGPVTEEKTQALADLEKEIHWMRHLYEKTLHEQKAEKRNNFVHIAIAADMSKNCGYGNCGEMGAVGLMRLSEIGWPNRAGMFEIIRPEFTPLPNDLSGESHVRVHNLLIVGLGTCSKVEQNDYQSFGVNSVVCDSYSRQEPYSILEINDRLHNYYGLNPDTLKPMLSRIDPQVDSIQLLCSNIFSANEFIMPFLRYNNFFPNAHALEIAHLLHSFNTSSSREYKLEQMHEILNKMPSLLNALDQLKDATELDFEEKRMHISRYFNEATQLNDCLDNAYSLCSQLERFKDPNSAVYSRE